MNSELVEILKDDVFINEHCHQNLIEVEKLLKRLGNRKFSSFLEIGGCHGGSLWIYTNLLINFAGKVIVLDIDVNQDLKNVVWKLNRLGYQVTSYEKHSLGFLRNFDGEFDFVHIDGQHDYHVIKQEFALVYPKLKKHGIILLHDTFNFRITSGAHIGCVDFREELEQKYRCENFISNDSSVCGITLLEKNV